MVVLTTSAAHAQQAEPSFDCRRAKAPDERVICNDSRLAELDQAVAIAYSQTGSDSKQEAHKVVRESLAARHSCGGDRICYIPAIADSHIGDEVLLCLVSLPMDCPPGDYRGKFYSATNLKTKGFWLLPDAQHMCGGA
jgi:hypothetical protein